MSLENKTVRTIAAIFLVFGLFCASQTAWAQGSASVPPDDKALTGQVADPPAEPERNVNSQFRVEKIRVDGGADLLTIFARLRSGGANTKNSEIPLISVVRDTLGDNNPENDRLRYVWMLTHTKASTGQTMAAFVPFLYTRTANKKNAGTAPPPPIFDMNAPDNGPWAKIFRVVFNKFILGQISYTVRASVLQYERNTADYRRTAIAQALAVLSLYQAGSDRERQLKESELKDIQARLWLHDKFLGWHMGSENLTRVYEKELAKTRDIRNQNWELLRQYSEAQGLYFDPLEMSDGSSRHAIVWADAADIKRNNNKEFNRRFLNIKSPWNDPKLLNWKGYSQVRWFDEANREVSPDTPDAKPRTLIPLSVYGLEFPKIPTLLVDFRDNYNVKLREMSGRLLNDVTFNVLAMGIFSSLPYTVGRFSYDYFTGRRGVDINQASRLRSYSQLKLLLSLDPVIDTRFKDEIAKRLEHATLNPLENDLDAETSLARGQYENLIAYAKSPDGLQAKLDKDRRAEMVGLVHSGKERTLYSLKHFLSFGLYTRREQATPELMAKLDIRRQLDHHERYLREVAFNSAKPEIDSDAEAVKRSLLFVSENGASAKGKTSRALVKIFSITDDEEMRNLSLAGLYRINNSEAKKQLLAIYGDSNVTEDWRSLCAHYLKLALEEGQQISPEDARAIAGIEAN